MKSLQVSRGDIALGSNRRVSTVYAKSKLLQDLSHWLLEPLGTSSTTPSFGSRINELAFGENTSAQSLILKDEITRVLTLYQNLQFERVKVAQKNGELKSWSKQEIIASILAVDVEMKLTTAIVTIKISTLASTTESISLSITPAGTVLTV